MILRFLALMLPVSALGLPAPGGLNSCAAQSSAVSDMEHMAATLHGEPLGCFQSGETVELRGTKGTHVIPVEYAFAVEMKSRPYTQQDLDTLMSAVTEQWKNSPPLSLDTRADYNRRLDDLIGQTSPGTPKPAAAAKPPVLVSIEQPERNLHTIVSILRRQVSFDGEFFDTTRVDAAAVVLKGATLIRLSLVRELRSRTDVGAVREEMADWAAAVAAAP